MARTAVLSRRALDRALLARQLLLDRADLPSPTRSSTWSGSRRRNRPTPTSGCSRGRVPAPSRSPPLRPLPRAQLADLEAEGHRLLATTAPGAAHAVRITRPA